MKQRWLVVAIGLPLLLLVLLACPAWATMLLVCAIAGIAAYELLHTAGKNVPTSIYLLTVAAAAAYEVLLYYSEWTFFGTIQPMRISRLPARGTVTTCWLIRLSTRRPLPVV